MALFAYSGTDDKGAPVAGRVEAPSLSEASRALWGRGVEAASLARVDAPKPEKPPGDVDAFIFFNRSLAETSAAGMPLDRSVREIAAGMRSGRFRDALGRVEAALREGRPLDEAVERERDFPPEYRWIVRAGLACGNLPCALAAVARHAEGIRGMQRAIASALAYPVVVLALGAAAAVAFAAACLPLYETLYREFRMTAPATLTAARILTGSVYVPMACVGALVALVLTARLWMRASPGGERMLYRMPLMGRLIRDARVVRFLRCLGMLMKAGVPPASAIPVADVASGSAILRREGDAMRARIAEGGTVGDALSGSSFLPAHVVGQLAAAERAGRLVEMIDGVADLLEEETAAAAGQLHLILRPSAIIATGALMALAFFTLASPYLTFLRGLSG